MSVAQFNWRKSAADLMTKEKRRRRGTEKTGRNTTTTRETDARYLQALRSEVNIELNFPPKLRGARSRLCRRRFLQVNTRWKALAEIYTMHSFAPFWNPLAKNGEKGPGQNNPEKEENLHRSLISIFSSKIAKFVSRLN